MPNHREPVFASPPRASSLAANARLPSAYAEPIHRVAFGAFLVLTLPVWVATLVQPRLPGAWQWVDGIYIALAAITVLTCLARRLPWQNVGTLGLVIFFTSGMMLAVAVQSGFPLGRLEFSADFGPRLLGFVAWPMPFLWVAVLLASRQGAKVILRPWRRLKGYGWLLLGVSIGLAVFQMLALEPLGHRVKAWWSWADVDRPLSWYGAPLGVLLATPLLITALLVLATPWLLPKRPTGQAPPFEPVVVWLALEGWFGLGNLRAGLVVPGGIALAAMVAVGVMAWRGRQFTVASPTPHAEPASVA